MNQRTLEPELMDDHALAADEHLKALRGLARINQLSRISEALWVPIKNYYHHAGHKPLRILDVASGAGDIVLALTRKAKKENLPLVFEGCDYNPRAVDYAEDRARRFNLDIHYFQLNALSETIPERFDIVINSLFLHHLNDDQLTCFLKSLKNSKVKLLVFCDLKRSLRGLALCYLGTRLLSRSSIVHLDGLQSVRAAFTPKEILQRTSQAGLENAQLKSIWPMRYVLTWTRP